MEFLKKLKILRFKIKIKLCTVNLVGALKLVILNINYFSSTIFAFILNYIYYMNTIVDFYYYSKI